jgi:glycine betaine/proline transport system ATP-binding protein
MTEKIQLSNLYKVFGEQPHLAMELLAQGVAKEEILKRTGQSVGVQDASFTVNEGEIFVVMGLSGSGKSTLIRLLNRLIEPTSGKILLDGQDIAKLSEAELLKVRRRDMSMVFQSFALMPHLTVADNVAFGLDLAGVPRERRRVRAMTALEQVGLHAWAQSYPDELSGGMQQRVGLARALANDPTVLLMDEAFSALDPLIRTEMQDELLKLQAEHRRTIIFISHDLDEAMRLGDRIAIMEGGRIVQQGTPRDIFTNPVNDYVADFVAHMNPLGVLTARDVMGPPNGAATGEVPPETPLSEIMERVEAGPLAVVEDGRAVGQVTPRGVLARLAGRHEPVRDDAPPPPPATR